MINFNLFGTGDKDKSLLTYPPLSPPNTVQLNSATNPLMKPYITLGASSGDGSGSGVAYWIDTVKYPDSQSSFGNAKRLLYTMRNTGGIVDFKPVDALNPGTFTPGPLAILANLSSGQFAYFGPTNGDLFARSVFDNTTSKWITIVSEQVIAQGCRPFYAKYNDVLELCLVSPGNIAVNLAFQLANFDVPIFEGDFGGGGYISQQY